MKYNVRVAAAVAGILSAPHGAFAVDAAAASDPSDAAAIAEITVTATRRTENMQNVPIAIQALTTETLTQLNVTTFDDFVKFLPNVTVASSGPGVGEIYMRGLATTQGAAQSDGAAGSFPNVAVYLDDQSAQLPGRNLDIYTVDMERIEVLEGPQGTLFGAGAQAGVIRYITNKPILNTTEANFNAGYAITAHGDPSTNLDATVNLPLIEDRLAARVVVYNESRGGYINNVPSTFTRRNTDVGIVDYFGGQVPAGSESINNNSLVANHINPVTYKGVRGSALYKIDEDWTALITQSYQDMEADGVFAVMSTGENGEKLPDLSVQQFNPSYDKDKFSNTAWTLNGRAGALKLVYTGGYLTRNVDQVADYTNYSRGVYADYYQCILPGSLQAANLGIPGGKCFSPSSSYRVLESNTHQSHEFRVSTPDDARLRALGGLFWEDFRVNDDSEWSYKDPAAGFHDLAPPPGASVNNPNVRNDNIAFYDDVKRGYKQKAAFGSVDFELIPKVLTLTAGTRYYEMDTYERGAKASSFGCRPGGLYSDATVPDPCVTGAVLDTYPVPPGNSAYSDSAVGLRKRYSGFKSRGNLSWKVRDDILLYGTWSQGFRPGGFNRSSGFVNSNTSPLAGTFLLPIGFKPDVLTNKELGWKTQWFDNRLQFNGAVYQEDWKDVQISLFDPGLLGNLVFTTNGPDYRVRGAETEVVARITHGLTVMGSASWNSSELVNSPTLYDKTGAPITSANPYGAKGSPLAQSPPFQGSLRVRYDFAVNGYKPFWQLVGTHRAHSYSSTDRLTLDLNGNSIAYNLPAFSTLDGSIGIAKDAWNVQIYGSNLTDKRAILNSSYAQWIKMDTVNRPRTLNFTIGYRFGP